MKKYRKKPVVIEAIQFNGLESYLIMCETWGQDYTNKSKLYESKGILEIETLEGFMSAKLGDYIIKGVKGEFYPCKPDIFEQTHEEVEE